MSILTAKFWRLTGSTNIAPRYFILSLRCIAFRLCMACYRRKILFVQKQPLRTAFLVWQKCTLLSLGGAGGQTVHNRSTFGAPLKTNELCGRSVGGSILQSFCYFDISACFRWPPPPLDPSPHPLPQNSFNFSSSDRIFLISQRSS